MSSHPSDSELAQAMQEQYRHEFLARQAQKNSMARASAPLGDPQSDMPVVPVDVNMPADPPGSSSRAPSQRFSIDEDEALARRLAAEEQEGQARTSRTTSEMENQERRDAELALRLSQGDVAAGLASIDRGSVALDEDARLALELQDAELAHRLSRTTSTPRVVPQIGSHTARIAPSEQVPATVQGSQYNMDVNSSQMLADEELARRYASYEQDAASRMQAQRLVQQQRRRRRWTALIIPCVCVAVAITIPLLFVFDVINRDDFDDIPGWGDNDDIIDNDPFNTNGTQTSFNSTDVSRYNRWENDGNGLKLKMINALEPRWHAAFYQSVSNWDAGVPDSLDLTTVETEYEYECSYQDGVMKSCNGNYGRTGWRGANQVTFDRQRRRILGSVALFNEYYLKGATPGQMLYVACHEHGHGFGCPHWDTDFDNADLGNCMDYTNNPEDNAKPDASNFQFLYRLYGEFPPQNRRMGKQGAKRSSLHASQSRSLRFLTSEQRRRYEDADQELRSSEHSPLVGPGHHWSWVSEGLGQDDFSFLETHLGEDVYVRVHLLRANEGEHS